MSIDMYVNTTHLYIYTPKMYTKAHSICPYTYDALLRHREGEGWLDGVCVCVWVDWVKDTRVVYSCRFSSVVFLKPLPGLFTYKYIIHIRLLTASVMKKIK